MFNHLYSSVCYPILQVNLSALYIEKKLEKANLDFLQNLNVMYLNSAINNLAASNKGMLISLIVYNINIIFLLIINNKCIIYFAQRI